MIEITLMKEEHIKAVAELEKMCFSEPWSEKSLLEEIENDNAFFIVLVENERLLGYGGMHIVCGECYIDNIAVFKSERGKGYGKKITEELIIKAQNDRAEFISLEVRASNLTAIRLYEICGFIVKGKRKNFYHSPDEDALIMTKNFIV